MLLKHTIFTFLFFCSLGISLIAQGPNVLVQGDTSIVGVGDTVQMPVKTAEFWNIVTCNGSMTWDTSVIQFIDVPYYGLPHMTPATFNTTQAANGILSWTWQHLISIGGTLPDGDSIFSVRFRAVGNIGQSTLVSFPSLPVAGYWYNFAAWSGPLDTLPGQVIIGCLGPNSGYSFTSTNYDLSFQSTGNGATSWQWDFGDGNSDTIQNPQHSYSQGGNYTVCLITMNSCGQDTFCQNINVTCAVPGTNFGASANLLAYSFSDQSSNSPSAWFWDFGDGNTSTLQNPNHSYSAPGTYTVCLTTTNVCGSDSSCTNLIAICPIPSTTFGDSILNQAVFFSDLSGNNPTSWLWDFGDGNTSTLQNPLHTYAAPGNYMVCLTSSNSCGTDSSCHSVAAICPTSIAAFTYNFNALSAAFNDLSTNSPSTWSWDFGDGNFSQSQNPNHTYASEGTYIVCLNVINSCGLSSVCDTITVSCPAPAAAFSFSPAMATVSFLDASSNSPTSWIWDFGDGNSSLLQNPVHTYALPGTYQVCFNSVNDCGSDTLCQNVTVTFVGIDDPKASFIKLWPNPVRKSFQITISGHSQELLDFEIVDHYGRVLSQRSVYINRSVQNISFRSDGLAQGHYFLRSSNMNRLLNVKPFQVLH